MTAETVTRQLSLQSMIRPHCPKPFCVYCVPACCHGNAVQDFKSEPVPPSLLLFYPLFPPLLLQGLTSLFIQAWWLSHASLSLPSFLWSVSHSLPLTLPAKWNLANCFLLLIPWLCKHPLTKHTPNTNWLLRTQKQITRRLCKHT